MKKIVYIVPHLSTGGLPQYLVKQIESIKDIMDVYCVEWEDVTGGVLVVQRNKIVNLLGNKLLTLPDDKYELVNILNKLKPDVVHLQEIPELFMRADITDVIYSADREYALVETSHDSGYNIQNKVYLPDKFLMVSKFQVDKYKTLGVPTYLVEYPIENKVRTKTREQALKDLGLDPNLKHVINVGLFTPRKNQAEIIEYARLLQNYNIQFHFIGNQAENFKFYWEPIMKNFPTNCKWWNERSDVDSFYEAADLFLFTSQGHDTDRETMPLVIREALSWKVPSLIYNLPVYMAYFDKYETIEYLTSDLQKNAHRIAEKLFATNTDKPRVVSNTIQTKDCIVIGTYPIHDVATQITKEAILHAKKFNIPIVLTSHCPIPTELQELVDYCVVDKNNIMTYHTWYKRAWYNHLPFYADINLRAEGNHIYHGPAAYGNYYNGILFADMLGFDNVYCWNYDVWIKDDSFITKMQTKLHSKQAVMKHIKAEDGDTLQTLCFGIKPAFFKKHFPKIQTEQEYTQWMKRVGSESNGLENMWYHTLKSHLHDIHLWSEEEYQQVLTENKMEICSMVEYYTVLPVENDPTQAVAWFSTNNIKDNRVVKLYINDVLTDTKIVNDTCQYYKFFTIRDTNTVKFEVIDPVNNKTVKTKVIHIDEQYLANNLNKNGIFRLNENR